MTYDGRLAKGAFTRRPIPPQPGTPEANPSATLIEPKAKVVGGPRGMAVLLRRPDGTWRLRGIATREGREARRAERAEDPRYWVALPVLPHGDGRRTPGAGTPTVLMPMPLRARVARRTVGEVDRFAGGTVRGSEWNSGWRWYLQVGCAVALGVIGVAILVTVAGLATFLD